MLVTIRCRPWHWEGRGVLLGDACHAVVPFFGQGANAAFEDCGYLLECLERHPADRSAAFREYQSLRKENTDTLAALSIENFREMRDRTRSRLFRLQKAAERGLQRLFPTRFVTLYNLVTFTRVPYTEAVNRVRKQFRRLEIGVYFFFLVISLLLLVWIIG